MAILASQLSKLSKKEKNEIDKIMHLHLQQFNNQIKSTQMSLRQGEKGVCFYCEKPGHHKKNCRTLNGIYKEKANMQLLIGFKRVVPFLLANTLEEIEIILKGEVTKALIDTGATLLLMLPN